MDKEFMANYYQLTMDEREEEISDDEMLIGLRETQNQMIDEFQKDLPPKKQKEFMKLVDAFVRTCTRKSELVYYYGAADRERMLR